MSRRDRAQRDAPRRTAKFGRRLTAICGAGVAAGAIAISASAAAAATPTGDYAPFAQCPTSVSGIICLYSDTTRGSISLPKQSVPITTPIVFQGGFTVNANLSTTFHPAANGQTLSAAAQTVPGGLLGLTPPALFPQPLQGILDTAINSVNGVTATAELVGTPQFNLLNFVFGLGTAVSLPVRIQLNNPILGGGCYIGSASSPLTLNLTTGPSLAVHGALGALGFKDGLNVVTTSGTSLVSDTFSVPGASGCASDVAGLFNFSGIVDPIVNLKEGIPALPGMSAAVLDGSSELGNAAAVLASEKTKTDVRASAVRADRRAVAALRTLALTR